MAHLADLPNAVAPATTLRVVGDAPHTLRPWSGDTPSPLLALVLSNAASISANVVMTVVIPWLVLSTTGNAAVAGLVLFAGAGGAATGALVAGRVVDRVGPVRTSALSDLLSGLAVVPLALVIALGRVEMWQVVVLAVVGTLVDAAGSTARQGMVASVADRSGRPREQANAMFTSAEHAGYLLGAPLAGVLIAALGVAGALWVVIAAFTLASFGVLRFVRIPDPVVAAVNETATLRAALAFIWSDPALRALVVFPTLAVSLVGPLVPIVLPVVAQQVFHDPIVLGTMVACFGVGGLLGTAAYGVIGSRVSRRLLYRAVFVVWPMTVAILAVLPALPVILTVLVILGTAVGALVPLQATIRQERSPAHLLPRVVGLSTASIPVVAPIGVVVTGVLIDLVTLQRTLLLMSLGAASIGALVLVSRATQVFDAERESCPDW